MRIDLLKQILAIPNCSGQEARLVEFLVDHVNEGGVDLRGTLTTDDWNNVCIRKGDAECRPCVAAHLDSVHHPKSIQVIRQDNIFFGVDENGQRAGIGADDKAGIFVCLELLERFDNIQVVFFGSEEIGCLGAYHAPAAWFSNVGYVMEFDCPGQGLVSYTCGGTRLFANDGDFIRTASPILAAHGLMRWQHHPFTNVMALRQRFDLSCLNLSCGYYDWHTSNAYLALDEVAGAVAAGAELIETLGCQSFSLVSGDGDGGLPPMEITGFHLPRRSR